MGNSKSRPSPLDTPGYLRTVEIDCDRVESFDIYPFDIPAVRHLGRFTFDPHVTFFVGENGSGKSTLVEAIALAAGFNAEGGSKNHMFATNRTESSLHDVMTIGRGWRREKDGFFLRAESFYNVATQVDELGYLEAYGGKSLHQQSHGESFIALVSNKFRGRGVYILDEPEAALSPSRQLALLALIDDLVRHKESQFVIATHSPILLAYPHSTIYGLDADGIAPIKYEDTEHYKVTRDFLTNRGAYLRHLMDQSQY